MIYNQLMDREALKQALRGRSCYRCKYLIDQGVKQVGELSGYRTYDYVTFNPPHCSLRTDSKGKPTEKSGIDQDQPCKHYWEKASN